MIVAGQMTVFTHVYGSDLGPESGDRTNSLSQLGDRSGHVAQVVRPLADSECDPECQPMWRLRFSDGWECDAFEDELSETVGI